MSKISVIIPIYKVRENYLKHSIESVLNQTLSDIEIILVDDGSPDNCGSICDEYMSKDSRVKVIHCKNGGVSKARNIGISHARGDYIMFLDADDWLEEDTCEKSYNHAADNNSEIVMFTYDNVYEDRTINHSLKGLCQEIPKEELYLMQLVILESTGKYSDINLRSACIKLFNRNFIINNNLRFIEDLKRGEDMLFNMYSLEIAKKVFVFDFNGYHYRVNEESESHTYTSEILEISKNILINIKKFIKDNHKNQLFIQGYYAYSIESIFEQMYMYFFHYKNNESIFNMIKNFLISIKNKPYRDAPYRVKLQKLPRKCAVFVIFRRFHITVLFCILYILKSKIKYWGRK